MLGNKQTRDREDAVDQRMGRVWGSISLQALDGTGYPKERQRHSTLCDGKNWLHMKNRGLARARKSLDRLTGSSQTIVS